MSPNDYTPATETDYLFAEDMAPAVRKSASAAHMYDDEPLSCPLCSVGLQPEALCDCDEPVCCRCHRIAHVEAPGWRWSA